jgi:hypothetical protein
MGRASGKLLRAILAKFASARTMQVMRLYEGGSARINAMI